MELTSGSQLLHQPVMSFWRPAKKPISGGQLWHQPLVASYELLAASNVIDFWRAAMVPAAPGSLLKLLQHLLAAMILISGGQLWYQLLQCLLAASNGTNFWRPTMAPAAGSLLYLLQHLLAASYGTITTWRSAMVLLPPGASYGTITTWRPAMVLLRTALILCLAKSRDWWPGSI